MKKIIDLESWSRKEHFDFFNGMDNPFWGLVSTVDLSQAIKTVKSLNTSLYSFYLYQILKTLNQNLLLLIFLVLLYSLFL